MGRKVKIRVSLASDVTYLGRLMNAIEKDVDRPIEWRRSVVGKLKETIALLVQPLSEDSENAA